MEITLLRLITTAVSRVFIWIYCDLPVISAGSQQLSKGEGLNIKPSEYLKDISEKI